MSEREKLEQAITAQESLRGVVDDAVIDAAIAVLQQQLTTLGDGAPPEHRRKLATVLFVDVVGSTRLMHGLDPEDVNTIMDSALKFLADVVDQHGGHVTRFTGDGFKAVFGIPVTREDDPERAIAGGLRLVEAAGEFAQWLEREWGRSGFDIRVGIDTGFVVTGGFSEGRDTVMGLTVHLAARLEASAPPGSVLISHNTYRHVRGIFDVEPVEPIQAKGFEEPIQAYIVRKIRPRAFRLVSREIEGIETRMVGRERELTMLQESLEKCSEESAARAITVVGEAGLGKSRLLFEFEDWLNLRTEDVYLFRGRALEGTSQLPFSLFRDIFSFRFEILETDNQAIAQKKFKRGIIQFLGEEGRKKAPFIGHIMGFDFSDNPHIRGLGENPGGIYKRAFQYVSDFFLAVASDSPTVLLLEDLHWADEDSLDLLAHLIRGKLRVPLFILMNARPSFFETAPDWDFASNGYTRIDLKALSRENCHSLMLDILQRVNHPPETLLDTIFNNSEGNPLYIEELVKMMVEDGIIVKGDEMWEVEPNRLSQQRVPPTLAGIIQARLERLSKPELDTIQCASVIGRVFWNDAVSSLFCSVRPSSQAVASESLSALQKKEWIYLHPTTAFAGTKEYIFKHVFFREAAYEQLLKGDRQIYHNHAAEWLIQKSTDRADEYAGLIAGHFEQAGETKKAGVWYLRAGEHAQNAYANETAIHYYQKSLDFSEELADKIALLEKIGRLLGRLTRSEEAIEVFHHMYSLSQSNGNPKRQIDALLHLSRSEEQLGNHPVALAQTENAEEILLNLSDPDPYKWAEILHRKGWVHYRLGEMELAYACANEGLEITRNLETSNLTAKILNLLGAIYVYRGVFPLATDYYEQSLTIHRNLENPLDESIMLVNLGEIHRLNGDFGKAISRYKEGIEIARNIDNRELLRLALSNLGGAQVGLGDWKAALETIQQVLDEVDENWVLLSETYRFLCEAHLGEGDLEASLSAAREAWRLANGSGNPELLGNAWRILGLVAVRLEEPISPALDEDTRYTAAENFARSVELLTEGGVERDRALALWDWACYEMAFGDCEKGKTMWAEARKVFETLEMHLLVEKMDLCLTEPSGHLLHGGSHA